MSTGPQHEDQTQQDKAVNAQFADVILGVILHANGGEFTVTAEQMKSYLKIKTRQALTRQVNPDGSITFRLQPCPQHDERDDLIHDEETTQ